MGIIKRTLSCLIAFICVLVTLSPATVQAEQTAKTAGISADGYDWQGKWIWSHDEKAPGQWVSFRKTFELDSIPETVMARISVDSKYWMWVNGEMAIFEGGVKTGENKTDMYYDYEDISEYLQKGSNTIAVLAVYFGKSSYGFKDSGQPGFYFDAEFEEGALKGGGTRVVSDSSWKAIKNPAYEAATTGSPHAPDDGTTPQPGDMANYRLSEPSIKYDASKELADWETAGYNDSEWSEAKVVAEAGAAPYNGMIERPIPQLNVEEITKFTADGTDGTGTWKEELIAGTSAFTPLSLPDEYTISYEFMVENKEGMGTFGPIMAVQDADNFYMPQVSMYNYSATNSYDHASYKPHVRVGGQWTTPLDSSYTDGLYPLCVDQDGGQEVIEHDQRFGVKHTMDVRVDSTGYSVSVDNTELSDAKISDAQLKYGTLGFRADSAEVFRVYSAVVMNKNGDEIFRMNLDGSQVGSSLSNMKVLSGSSTPTVQQDEDGEKYLSVTDTIAVFGKVDTSLCDKKYTIRNRTNIQGTPYLKVNVPEGQEGGTIRIWTDAWYDIHGVSVSHSYITKAGEQEWEAYGWINGWDVYFEVPAGVEVLELGFRPSTYNTTAAGSFQSDDGDINKLYQMSYDTLLVTMRDTYMDCPTRERAQWWGDAVNEMQMACYAMDENAALLYKKTLNQTINWTRDDGSLPTTASNPIDPYELPMQNLAGVHSFWQYYMYTGDIQPLEDGYDVLLNYLKKWSVQDNGLVVHRQGSWDWMDWGDHPDASVIENCWYYIAAEYMANIATELGKPQADIDWLEGRMSGIESSFESAFWNEEKKAYYGGTDNNVADDRANALAVYVGLAEEEHFADIKNVLTTVKNSSPYMEKYVLEALYMMGYDKEAMARTKERFGVMLDYGYPTLWEFWDPDAGTKNHAWAGASLSMNYLFNIGVTPLTPAYETFQVRPQTADLKSIESTVPTPNGDIKADITVADNDTVTLKVTVPEGCTSADICVPRLTDKDTKVSLGETVIYENGGAKELPDGVSYKTDDKEYITFTVKPGSYTFATAEDTGAEANQYTVTVNGNENGTVYVNGEKMDTPAEVKADKNTEITVKAEAKAGYVIDHISGSEPEDVSASSFEKTYTVDRNMTITVNYAQKPLQKYSVSIGEQDGKNYAASLLVNGEVQSLPFSGKYTTGETLEIEAIPTDDRNYIVAGWTGVTGSDGSKATVTVGETDMEVRVNLEETVEKIPVTVVSADDELNASPTWDKNNLVNGNRTQAGGYTTNQHPEAIDGKLENPIELVFDLGAVKDLNQVSLFPRTDAFTADGKTCNFPVDFTIQVSEDGTGYTTVKDVTGQENPCGLQQIYSFDDSQARYVKISVTRLGEPAADEGGDNWRRIQLAQVEFYNNTDEKAVDVPLEELLAPVWEGDTVYNESVMVLAEQNGTIEPIQLAYPITEIVAVYDSALQKEYKAGEDYEIRDGKLVIPEGSSIPITKYDEYYLTGQTDNSLPAALGGYLYFSEGSVFHKKQIAVTYKHEAEWTGEVPDHQSHKLQASIEKLQNGENLNIVFYGDSITVGANASSFVHATPMMPTWSELVVKALKNKYGTENINYVNTAVGGMTSQWGLDNVHKNVVSHNPDLVFIGFGMNDSWEAGEYKAKIQGMIDAVRADNPDCEFVLVAPMLPNEAVQGFYRYQHTYAEALKEIAQTDAKIAVADVTAIHSELLESKDYYDMTGNNVNHPNDFLGRIYAQVVMAAFEDRDTYSFVDDYQTQTATDGIWRYYVYDGSEFKAMEYDGDDGDGIVGWRGPTLAGFAIVQSDSLHPDSTVNNKTVLQFAAPKSGTVTISFPGGIQYSYDQGDGVKFSLWADGTEESGKLITDQVCGVGTTKVEDFTVTVKKGQKINFMIDCNANNAGDTTKMNPTITYKSADTITDISDISKVYDGNEVSEPTFTQAGSGAATIEYKLRSQSDETYTTEKPVKAGDYVVRITVEGDSTYEATSAVKEFKISPKEITADVTVKAKQYDGLNTAEIESAGLEGIVGNDQVTLNNGTPTFTSVEAADNVPVQFTPFTLSGADAGNYTLIQPAGVTAEIFNKYEAKKDTDYTVSTDDWTNEAFTVTAKEGYELSLTNTAAGSWTDSLVRTEEATDSELVFYVKNTATGAISKAVTERYNIDKTAPAGTVTIGENSWNEFLNTITFDLFFRETQSVKINAEDSASGVGKVEYYESEKALDLNAVKALGEDQWKEGKSVSVTPEDAKKFVYYARITDKAGNIAYLSSDGAQFDTTAPVIHGLDGITAVCEDATFTVTEENLASVTANGEELVPDQSGAYVVKGNDEKPEQEIVVTDKAGNTAVCTVKVYAGHAFTEYTPNNDATETDNATETAECDHGCGATDTREIPDSTLDKEEGTDAKPEKEESGKTESAASGTPETGDSSNPAVWIGLLAVSGITAFGVYRKKRHS